MSTLPSEKKTFFHHWLPIGLTYSSMLLLFAYTVLRAHLLSMTHDESGSFFSWMERDIYTCRTNPICWTTANLHWLYVVLMKESIRLFGNAELTVRLPALLGHLFYLIFSFKLVKLVTSFYEVKNQKWMLLLGFILLNINAFHLEFQSLARGYGLATSMMMVSLYYLAQWIIHSQAKHLWGTVFAAFLAVLSNFTWLLYFATLLAVLFLFVIRAYFLNDEKKKAKLKWTAIGSLSFVALMVWLLFHPIQMLKANGEFLWGVDSFYDTILSVIRASLYRAKYVGMYNLELFGALFFILLFAATFKAFSAFIKTPKDNKKAFFLITVLIPLFITIATISQHYILGSMYPTYRKAIMYIPLCALPIFMFFNYVNAHNSHWSWKAIMVIVGLFSAVHLVRVANFEYTKEWIYDCQTENMMAYMNEIIPEGETVTLGVHWQYQPSSQYYWLKEGYDFCPKIVYSKKLRTDGFYDYYYVRSNDVPELNADYEIVRGFTHVGILMKRKEKN